MNSSIAKRFVSLAILVIPACQPRTPQAPAPANTIQFLLVNDVYIGEPMENGLGGIARLKTLKAQLEKTAPTKLMIAGDFLFPSLLSKWYKGAQVVEYFNSAGLNYATYGNHEFDDSRQTLVDRISESKFKWTSANCVGADGSPLPGASQWDTLTVAGVKFGLFGVTIRQAYPRWIKCGGLDSAVHATIPKLKAQGAQIIVGLTHTDRAADSSFLANEPDIDFILGGHEHEWQIVELGNRFVVKADRNAQTAQVVTLTREGSAWKRTHRLVTLDATIPPDASAGRLVAKWQDSLEKRLGPAQVIATTSVPIDVTNAPLRRRETQFGNFIADAMRAGTGADVAATIGGAMRLDDVIDAGPITNRQIESIYLFPDESRIVTFTVPGLRLREILEHSISRGGDQFGGYLQLSGVRFEWDSSRVVGQRIVGEIRRSGGSVIGANDAVRLSINAYTACDGGDGYSIPESAEACKTRETHPRAAQLVIDYMRARKTIALPPVGRVKRVPVGG